MEIKQNPFSFYDFLGYFVPGSLVVYLLFSISAHASFKESSLLKIINLSDLKGVELYTPLILIAYISGHLINFISAITVEKHLNWMYGFPSKTLLGIYQKSYFTRGEFSIQKNIIRLMVALLLLPLSGIDFFLSKTLKTQKIINKELDPATRELLKQKMEDTLKRVSGSDTLLAESLVETNYFLFIYHFALENAPQHVPKMQNYVALFGLMRTLTFYFILLFWVASWHLIYSDASLLTIAITLPALSVVSYLFYLSFIKFYRRFTLEAMMAAAVVEKPTHQEKPIPS
ncbi:hypothetical protein PYV50_09615 [Pseudomonas sp. H22_DOA]|nr:hypothetical protein PYV50_09615 [Pseudomonas sp. H22_DOA]